MNPTIAADENKRLEALHSYRILYAQSEKEFDQITDLASLISGMPISLISFVDKDEVWYKAAKGTEVRNTDRNVSFCSYTVNDQSSSLVVEDIKQDPRFVDHPYASKAEAPMSFYAGVCLIDRNGYKLGTLCVIDTKPNTISEKQLSGLQTLAAQIVKLIELRKAHLDLKKFQVALERKNEELKSFAGVVSHDMKMPLANIILTTDILKSKYGSKLDEQGINYLSYLKQSSFTLSDYISGILAHYESDKIASEDNQTFDIHDLLERIVDLLNINLDCEINFPEKNIDLDCNRAALEQILINLIGNSLKYNDKERIIINIACEQRDNYYYFKVSDNGVGIPEENQESIFDLFSTMGLVDRNGNKGNGIGLSTVKKIINSLGGSIFVASRPGEGTDIEFSILSNQS